VFVLLNAATEATFLAWKVLTASVSATEEMLDLAIVNLTILPPATEADNAASKPKSAHVADAEVMFEAATVTDASFTEYPFLPSP